jgi:t-SNARE complex subunit (syntaxin)
VAIVFAAQVNTKLAAGDIAGAQESARNARMWTWIAFGCGIVLCIIYAIWGFSMGFLGALRRHY